MEELRRDPIPDAWPQSTNSCGSLSVAGLHTHLRVAAEDIELSGPDDLPPTTASSPWLAGANHDPEQFDEPERVDFHRPTVNHHTSRSATASNQWPSGSILAAAWNWRSPLEIADPSASPRSASRGRTREDVVVKHDSGTFRPRRTEGTAMGVRPRAEFRTAE